MNLPQWTQWTNLTTCKAYEHKANEHTIMFEWICTDYVTWKKAAR